MKVFIIIMAWLLCGIIGAGFLNPTMISMKGYDDCQKWAARDQAVSIGLGLFGGPMTLFIGIVYSGFGYDGWSLYRKEC